MNRAELGSDASAALSGLDPHANVAVTEGRQTPFNAPKVNRSITKPEVRHSTPDIVARLWKLCDVLRDDGVTYHQYVTELTYLLFLKMAHETGSERRLPRGYRWSDLAERAGEANLSFYKELLVHLGTEASPRVRQIYANAVTTIRHPKILSKLVLEIDRLDWYSAKHEGLGDLYEGLLEKNAAEKKSGAGQYFTPRALIESIVRVVKPQPGEIVQDPAAGTGGFLISAHRYITSQGAARSRLTSQQREFQRRRAYYGMELVPDTHRLLLMNALLHDIESPLLLGDALSEQSKLLPQADVIVTNPPFGTKKGGELPRRGDLTYRTSNKQLAFLQHIYGALRRGRVRSRSRAAVVIPDNVLFEGNTGRLVRSQLMDICNLHTILRLPTGIFYAHGVKTNVLFFARGARASANTKQVWVYDMRTAMPQFGKRRQLTAADFADFESVYGESPVVSDHGLSKRRETPRFRCFERQFIAERGENLDLTWLGEPAVPSGDALGEAARALHAAMDDLTAAVAELRGAAESLCIEDRWRW